MTDEELRDAYPQIRWDEPLRVIRSDGVIRYVCRLCVARDGLRAVNLEEWPDDLQVLAAHLEEEHAY